jgi:hypothetical protein
MTKNNNSRITNDYFTPPQSIVAEQKSFVPPISMTSQNSQPPQTTTSNQGSQNINITSSDSTIKTHDQNQ